MTSPYVRHVHSQAEMTALLSEKAVVVVNFHAPWSGPCGAIEGFYSQLAAKHRTVTFAKAEIDADNIQSVGHKCRLTELPTFIMIEKEKEVDRICGPDRKALEDMVAKHAPPAELTANGSRSPDVIYANDISLLEYLDMPQVNCLNEAQDHTLKSIVEQGMRNTSDAYLESDVDEQLLVTLPFNQMVKVRSIVLHTKDPKFGPKDIKIDINDLALGFDDMEGATEPSVVQSLQVSEDVVKEGKQIQLRFVRLQRVNSLHIFVGSNHGNEDITRIDAVDVYGPSDGQPAATTQMGGLRNFLEIHNRGVDLLRLFWRQGDIRNLSDSVLVLREALLLCPTGNRGRPMILSNLTVALFTQYEQQGNYSDLTEIIPLRYQILELYPLGHPDRASSLANLSSALMVRYQREGSLADLLEATERYREALRLHPLGHPDRVSRLNNLSSALLTRYQREGSLEDLSEATERYREALQLCPPGHPDRASCLNNLSTALLARYEREGSLAELSEATEWYREALQLHPLGHRHHATSLGNLSNALMAWYQREGSPANLSEAIERYREALRLSPFGHPDRASTLNNLSSALVARYERERSLADLSEATEWYQEALQLHPPGHPRRAATLSNLSNALMARYDREGRLTDLSEATERFREALELRPLGHPDRAASLNNLSNALLAWYECEGRLEDLSEATESNREAVQLRPDGHPDRSSSLNNLSKALLKRYERESSLTDLYEATERCQEALQLLPLGHPDHASSLSSLSGALIARFEHKGRLADLYEATEQCREALQLRPPGHPDRHFSLNHLSNALLKRYQHEGSPTDLSEATEWCQEALQLCPPGHLNRASDLSNLSNALIARYEHKGSLADLSEATERCREAVQLCPPDHLDRAMSLNNLSGALLRRYQREGRLAYLSEATEWYREALQLHPRGHSSRAPSLNNLSNALVTRYEREGRLTDLSEAMERFREALQLHPVGHINRAQSLNNLSNVLMARYQREGGLADLSEVIEQYREALQLRPLGHPDRASSLNNLSNALLMQYQREGCLADLSKATEWCREALQLHPHGHPHRASSLSNLSNILLTWHERESNLADLSEATEQGREALALCPPGHPDRAQSLSSLSHVLMQAIDHTSGAAGMQGYRTLVLEVFDALREGAVLPSCPPRHRLRAALEWIDASRKLDPESALDAYMAALEQLDIVLATGNTLENKHAELSSSKELARCKRLGVEAASYALHQGHLTLAIELLERGRNLLFAQVGRYRVDLEDLRKVNAELADRFSDLSRLLDATVVSNQPGLEGRAFEDPIERYRRVASDWSQVVSSIRAVEGFEHFLRSSNYAALQSASVEGPVIVVIPGDGQSDALIISQQHDEPHHLNLPSATREKLMDLANSLLRAIRPEKKGVYDGATMEKPVKSILRLLWDLVVRPIADALEHELCIPLHSRVWWCPASILSALPLHAAGHYAPKNPDHNFPAKYVSSYIPTLQALSRARSKRSASSGQKTLIVAQPGKPESPGWLLNTQGEAELVKKLVEENLGMDATLLSGEEGTPAAVLEGMVDHSWLHLTCHGFQDFDDPFQSRFGLYDAPLTLHDVIQRGLPDATFAFLAACHTATGDITLLDEGLHLAAGLHFAGFKSVVGTFWEVADIDGPVIAEAFYKALQEEGTDCSKAAYALSKAVQHLRDIGVPVHRWMRFIHIGI